MLNRVNYSKGVSLAFFSNVSGKDDTWDNWSLGFSIYYVVTSLFDDKENLDMKEVNDDHSTGRPLPTTIDSVHRKSGKLIQEEQWFPTKTPYIQNYNLFHTRATGFCTQATTISTTNTPS